jgi:hypothetical protein
MLDGVTISVYNVTEGDINLRSFLKGTLVTLIMGATDTFKGAIPGYVLYASK